MRKKTHNTHMITHARAHPHFTNLFHPHSSRAESVAASMPLHLTHTPTRAITILPHLSLFASFCIVRHGFVCLFERRTMHQYNRASVSQAYARLQHRKVAAGVTSLEHRFPARRPKDTVFPTRTQSNPGTDGTLTSFLGKAAMRYVCTREESEHASHTRIIRREQRAQRISRDLRHIAHIFSDLL